MNINLNTEANRKCWETTKTVVKVAVSAAFTVAEIMVALKSAGKSLVDISLIGNHTYDGAIKAIMNSDMFSSDKRSLVGIIGRDAQPEVYRAVVEVLQSDMFSGDKVRTIKAMFNHE